MANREKIQQHLKRKPFRIFWLETTGGNRIRVLRPDWFYEPPEWGGEFVVFGNGVMDILNYGDLLDNVTLEGPPRLEKQAGNQPEAE